MCGPATIQVFRDPDIGAGDHRREHPLRRRLPSARLRGAAGTHLSRADRALAAGERSAPHVGEFAHGMTFTRYYWQLELDSQMRPTGREIVPGGPPPRAEGAASAVLLGAGKLQESEIVSPSYSPIPRGLSAAADRGAAGAEPDAQRIRTERRRARLARSPCARPGARTCANCGAELQDGQDWCLQCGAGDARQPRFRRARMALGDDRAGGHRRARAGRRRGRLCRAHQVQPPHAGRGRVVTVAQAPATVLPGTPTPGVPTTPRARTTPPASVPRGAGTPTTDQTARGQSHAPKIPLTAPTPKPSAHDPAENQASPAGHGRIRRPNRAAEQEPPNRLRSCSTRTPPAPTTPMAIRRAGSATRAWRSTTKPRPRWTARVNPAVAPRMARGARDRPEERPEGRRGRS